MKKCFFGAIAVLALASCSNEKVVELSQDQEIKLTAVTGKALSRAEHAYCNNDMPANFKVWANVPDGAGKKVYFSGDQFIREGETANYKNNGDARYWPNGPINLFACLNANPAWTDDKSTLEVKDFTVDGTVANQVDFIYAMQEVSSKPAADTRVAINFRHALSQVEFQARNENSKIYVEVKGVSVCRVADKNTFTFPTASTDDKVGAHNSGAYTDNFTGKNQGTWGATPAGNATYEVDLATAVPVKSTNTSVTVPAGEWDGNTMILMPQTITAWNKSAAAKPADGTGSYLLLNCKIWNIAAPNASAEDGKGGYNSTSDVLLWPKSGENYANIAIPFSGTWKQGKRYIYTFVFTSTGNGGTDPGTGDEVLTPIKLTVTVDDFVEGGNTVVDMVK